MFKNASNIILLALLCVKSSYSWERKVIDFTTIEEKAKVLATKKYVAPDKNALPDWMKNLSYDQYRDIRFPTDRSLWASDNSPFRAQFFHPGYLYLEPVTLNEFSSTHSQKLRYVPDYFEYGSLIQNRGEMPGSAGYAGFKVNADLQSGSPIDELVVFQGASYWRALGKGHRYGLSARGLAIDTGVEGGPEEFPRFSEFWLGKPEVGATSLKFYALLDSPSVAGAYEFSITPGVDTVMDVKAVLFPRVAVKRFGVAPLSSMYWFGENSKRRFDDFRPEVHDSDGLAIKMKSGEKIWRPITNDTGCLDFSFLDGTDVAGFGLLQRDRRFSAYEDGEAAYHLRPSVWIEPTNVWGSGKVMLMEIPTGRELDDNIVATWVPDETPQPGQRLEFCYRQHWTQRDDPSDAGGRVVATRTGVHAWQPEQRTMIVEFTGGQLDEIKDDKLLQANIEISGAAKDKMKVNWSNIHAIEGGRWRLSFQLAPIVEGLKLSDVGPAELRCNLKSGENFLTETWVYRIQP
jgi:periplasmic glucans biosynthesis protein